MTISYADIKTHCEESSNMTRAVIDDFLIYYTAVREKLDPQMDMQLKKYKRVAGELPQEYINFLKSEYIAHKIFSKEGYITRYLNHSDIRNLPEQQYRFLEFQSRNPWRFSFAEIRNNPEESFFEMEDVFTGEQYLLYSPGMQFTEKEYHPRLWFILIGFNGKCWQTYGLIIPFKSFTQDDIFYFATELNPKIGDEEMLMQEVENNTFPFFMLLSGSTLPVVMSRGHEVLSFQSSDVIEEFSAEKLSGEFISAWNKNVYRFTSNRFGEFPHYAIAYYHEHKKELIRMAMTEMGFEELTKALTRAGCDLNPDADIRVSTGMRITTEKILNLKILMNPYEELFSKIKDEREPEKIAQLNHFVKLALPFYNEKKEIDIKRLAQKAGIDEETAASLWELINRNMENDRKSN